MDTELARTFLAIAETGSFVGAAQRLHVTQSTVSARVLRLEEWLGARLFLRERTGCSMTSAGQRFQRHAASLTRLAEQSRRAVREAGGFPSAITIGAHAGLWEDFLCSWLGEFSQQSRDVAIRALVGHEEDLMQALVEGRADACIVYVPEPRSGVDMETLFEDHLVQVTAPSPRGGPGAGYVQVDWGPQFLAWHARAFPEFTEAAVAVSIGWLGLRHVLAQGGRGYFPLRLLREALHKGLVQRVQGAPVFRLPAYLCYLTPANCAPLASALNSIRRSARAIDAIDA